MSQHDFHFEDQKSLIRTKLGKSEWVTVYANDAAFENIDQAGMYSALVKEEKVDAILSNHSWDVLIGYGLPGFGSWYENGNEVCEYYRFSHEGIEPLIYKRDFHGVREAYMEISEEFRLYFNLYEIYDGPKKKKYLHFDDDGNENEVAIISEHEIKIKLKFLKQYLAARNMCLALYFEFMRFSEHVLKDLGIQGSEETIQEENIMYWHLIRDFDFKIGDNRSQSWLLGKKVIGGTKDFKPNIFGSSEEKKYEEFIIGVDEEGEDRLFTCDEEQLANYFGKNPDAPQYTTPVFFRKEVLNKFYSNPEKYSVQDGYIRCNGLWSLRLDLNHPDYVMVFLGDMGGMSHNEQLYWKSFNVSHEGPISRVAWERGFQGNFTNPDAIDLKFRMKYNDFQKKWFKKYQWHLFKPLSEGDSHHLKSLHVPLSNNQKEFDEQVLSLTKIMIDSLNEKKVAEGLTFEKPNPKGLDKFQAFLTFKAYRTSNGMNVEEMITFMRRLQSLRSVSVAHRKSENNDDYKKVQKYFEMDKKSFVVVFEDILKQTILIFDILEKHFLEPDHDYSIN